MNCRLASPQFRALANDFFWAFLSMERPATYLQQCDVETVTPRVRKINVCNCVIPSSRQILLPPPPLSKKWNIGTTDVVFISEFSLFHENYRLSSHCIIVTENYKHYFIIAHPSKITGNKEKSRKQRKTSMTSLLPVCSSPFWLW